MLEAKLVAGNSGFDIVTPSIHVLKRLSDVGLMLPLDKSRLPNLKHMDPGKMAKIAEIDTDNTYGIPYMELSTGIGYNEKQVREVMGDDFELNSWAQIFDEDSLARLEKCGVASVDSASDMLCSALIFLGLNPESTNREDYEKARQALEPFARHARYFGSAQYANELAAGESCVAVGWSGDIQNAAENAREAGLDPIRYVLPREGALMGYDMFAIPKDAKHVDNAYIFLNYIMRPDVIAGISNYIRYANANADATPLVDPVIRDNPGIYYTPEVLERMHIVVPPTEIERTMTRVWNRIRGESGSAQ